MIKDWWSLQPSQYDPIEQGANFYVTATDPAGTGVLPADSTNVATWVDKTAIAGNFTQGTGGNQPLFLLNQQNGNPGISFAGPPSTKFLEQAFSAALNTASFTMYIACRPTGNDTLFRSPFTSRDFSTPNFVGYWFYANNSNVFNFITADNTATPSVLGSVTSTNGVSRILTATCTNGAQTFRVGSTTNTGSANFVAKTVRPQRIGAGATDAGANFYWQGLLFSILNFPVVRTAVQQQNDRNFLQAIWGNI